MDIPKQEKTTLAPVPQKMVTFDDDGDLTLLVGTEKQEFRVCSRSLSRASPVFKRMLNGGFSESRAFNASRGESWVVDLPDDLPWAVEQVLYIVHCQFTHVPTTLESSKLHKILVFTEKYDMTEVIRPWVRAWMPARGDLVQCEVYHRVLAIAWELGAEGILDHVGKMLVQNCEIDEHGNLKYPNKSGLDSQSALPLVPPGFLDNVAATRLALIKQIFANLSSLIYELSKLIKDRLKLGGYCETPVGFGEEACHAMSLGAIMGGLGGAELESIWDYRKTPEEVSYPRSVRGLVTALKRIPDDLHHGIVFNAHKHSDECSPLPGFIAKIQKLVDSQSSALTQQHSLYMAEQRKKLGVEWEKPVEAKPVIGGLPEVQTANKIFGSRSSFSFGAAAGSRASAGSGTSAGPSFSFGAAAGSRASAGSGLFGGSQGPAASTSTASGRPGFFG